MPVAGTESTPVAPLRFGTAGLRGPVRDGLDAMNIATVSRASWAVAQVLRERGRSGALVVVGRDARHGSDRFAAATAEIFAAEGFSVLLLPEPLPTPVVAFAVRHLDAAAGIQITASHNPATDNGYKVYFDGGIQIIPPVDAQIEAAMTAAPPAGKIRRQPVIPAETELVQRYLDRAASVRRGTGSVRVALTPLHGVGGAPAIDALQRAGFGDLHVVTEQFAPDPDFPTVAFPNPEEPGATDALLRLADGIDADIAIALDPDADRCAVGVPTPAGWRMLSGDETGWLLGDYLLAGLPSEQAPGCVVASTVVSSRMLAAIAAGYGARHVETLTGFKWLARADAAQPGARLIYAYEEAIGHCVDPAAVRDKDGISAAVLACDLVATLHKQHRSASNVLDDLAFRHGVHCGTAVSQLLASSSDAAAVMRRLRATPLTELAGFSVATTDLLQRREQATDALIYTGDRDGTALRVVLRPSGTEPKIKCYIEVRREPTNKLEAARAGARSVCEDAVSAVEAMISTT